MPWETAVYKRNADTALASPAQECCWNELTMSSWFIHTPQRTLPQHQPHPCTVQLGWTGHSRAGGWDSAASSQTNSGDDAQCTAGAALSLGFKHKHGATLIRQAECFKNMLWKKREKRSSIWCVHCLHLELEIGRKPLCQAPFVNLFTVYTEISLLRSLTF